MRGCVKDFIVVCIKFNKFNNIEAQMQDSFHHVMLNVFCNHVFSIMIKYQDFTI